MQKASPPTHLLHSRTGDFLRCRLIAMRDDHIVIEIQLDEVEILRDRVSQIIWFHPDEDERVPDGQSTPENTSPKPRTAAAPLAQIIQPNGNRVTFHPQEVDGKVVSGTSDVLGACRFSLEEIDQLIFGKQIEVAASELAYHQWRLQPATEPLVAQDLDEPGSAAGTVSPLVGKPAPEIDLELLGGGRFKLTSQKGKIVVLDFWASWCGPCMQTMPLMEEAMQEFDENKVRLVSVKLEEPAGHVKSVLERHKLNVAVALDIDGVAARRYEANAIPQLVVVDGKGNIARLYVGGGRNVVEQLKTSIAELLDAGE
jgi:thiol-disulfide isomerase/thioredoxin